MKNRLFDWDVLGVFAFVLFCLSTIFMVFFSTIILEIGPKPLNKILVLIACIIPLGSVLLWRISDRKNWRSCFKKEMNFIPIILVFGVLNVIFSEDRVTSFKIMTLFSFSGISVFFVSSVLFRKRNFRSMYLWGCWASLVVLCIYGFFEYSNRRMVWILSYNPILASALMLLLLVGPFVLFYESSIWLKPFFAITVLCGIIVILMIGKRGAALGLMGMGLTLFILVPSKKSWVFWIVLSLVGTGWMTRNYLPTFIPKGYFENVRFVYRLENYPFAWHIFKKHPVFGTGLHAPLEKYLSDYELKTSANRQTYSKYVKIRYTLENLFLCGFVEAGSLFTLTYIAFILYLLRKYWVGLKDERYQKFHAALFLSPIIAFGIQAMTFDGLINGHINWLFHSYLGMMVNFDKT